jgi:hypothetical protein
VPDASAARLPDMDAGEPGPADLRGPVSKKIPDEVLRFAVLEPEQRKLLMHVHELLSEIPYGTVVLVMQDGKVIQIETSEKIRLR